MAGITSRTRYTRPLPDRLMRGLLALADAAAGAVPLGHGAGPAGQAARRAAAGAQRRSRRRHLPAPAEGDARGGAGRIAGPSPVDRPQTFPAVGPAPQARGADAGLRPAGAGAGGERGDGAAADAARHRGGECRGLGLLRLLGAACRPQRAGAGARQAQHRGLAARDRRRRPRRHRHQRLGLRHHGQGLWPHVRRRSGVEGEGRAGGAARQGRQRVHARDRSRERDRAAAHRRLSFGLFHAARPEGDRATQEAAARRRASS